MSLTLFLVNVFLGWSRQSLLGGGSIKSTSNTVPHTGLPSFGPYNLLLSFYTVTCKFFFFRKVLNVLNVHSKLLHIKPLVTPLLSTDEKLLTSYRVFRKLQLRVIGSRQKFYFLQTKKKKFRTSTQCHYGKSKRYCTVTRPTSNSDIIRLCAI